jgi:uncharacterized phage protein (TIGR02218 family)
MRVLDAGLRADLAAGATTLCRCWRLRRKDGVVLGFTDHDRPLSFDGTVFRADTGTDASALQTGNGLSVDNAQVIGALSDLAISEADIRSGRFDGAAVEHWLVDWRRPERRVHLFTGSIGEIKRTEHAFEAEVRGLAEALNVPVGRSIKRGCDRVLGDRRCRVDLDEPRYRYTTTAASGATARVTAAGTGGFPDGWFAGGVLAWTGGANAGLSCTIRRDRIDGVTRILDLALAPGAPVSAGDGMRLTAGCDKQVETCREKFDNFLNFRGFPHIPGEDWIVAYPKGGDVHDGSSLQRG